MRLGYILFNSLHECIEDDFNRLKAIGCDKIFKEPKIRNYHPIHD